MSNHLLMSTSLNSFKKTISFLIIIGFASCDEKSKEIKQINIQEITAKDLRFQEITDLRFRLKNPRSDIEDVKQYNAAMFQLWLSDSQRFSQLVKMKHVFREDQRKIFLEILDKGDPLNFIRFGDLAIRTDADNVAVITSDKTSSECRILLVENFNPPTRKHGTYLDESSNYATEMKKAIDESLLSKSK